jgi:protein SCO1
VKTKALSRLLLAVLGLTLAACAPLQNLLAPPTATPELRGVALNPPRVMPDFTLTGADGKQVKLSDLRGKANLIFFGYTHCPDICPISMADFKMVKGELGDDASKVNFIMISVDGSRDTPEVLGRYVKAFDPAFMALTGDEATVHTIGVNYGVHFEKQQPTGTQASYLVSHTTYSYLVDAQGRWRMVFPYKTPAASVAADVRQVLADQ